MEFETVIGLEVHAQLSTKSKIFSSAPTTYGAKANTQANIIDLGMPGVLPVLNKEVVNMAIKFGLAVGGTVKLHSVFARKNYFYPDLPKGYQISQYELPIVEHGHIDIQLSDLKKKTIKLTRAHLEEDAGKSIHSDLNKHSKIDLNRAGTPLIEIVSEPDMRSAKEAIAYLKVLHTLVRYLDICDGNMQEGSFRCDANVSVRKKGDEKLGTRAEIKNLNSFKFIEKAINYEVERQIELIESGGTVVQETRLYDSDNNVTRSMRKKEEANDYRYFPDPDLLPLILTEDYIKTIEKTIPELPTAKKNRFMSDFNLSEYDAGVLVATKELAQYFETVLGESKVPPKLAANWVSGNLLGALNKENLSIEESPVNASSFAGLLKRIHDDTISGKIAKTVFEAMFEGEGDADSIIENRSLQQVTDTGELEAIIDNIIRDNPTQYEQYKSGKDKLFGFFVGQVMKETGGRANPKSVNELLKSKLGAPGQ